MLNVKGKTALITGASRGIGRYISKLFCEKGIKVAGISRDISPINKMNISSGGPIKGYACDISNGKNVSSSSFRKE